MFARGVCPRGSCPESTRTQPAPLEKVTEVPVEGREVAKNGPGSRCGGMKDVVLRLTIPLRSTELTRLGVALGTASGITFLKPRFEVNHFLSTRAKGLKRGGRAS